MSFSRPIQWYHSHVIQSCWTVPLIFVTGVDDNKFIDDVNKLNPRQDVITGIKRYRWIAYLSILLTPVENGEDSSHISNTFKKAPMG